MFEHKSEEYMEKIHKFGMIPAWVTDEGEALNESNAILRYLSEKYNIRGNWWPEDLIKKQKVDEALDFCGTVFRPGTTLPFYKGWVFPVATGQPPPTGKKLERIERTVDGTLEKLETFIEDKKYVAGDEISIADLQIFSELTSTIIGM